MPKPDPLEIKRGQLVKINKNGKILPIYRRGRKTIPIGYAISDVEIVGEHHVVKVRLTQ